MAALPLLPGCEPAAPRQRGGDAVAALDTQRGGEAVAALDRQRGGEAVAALDKQRGDEAVAALDRPDAFWRDKVSPAAFEVLFENDTERAFSSPLNDEKRAGTFICAACYLPLFASEAKYDSGTGWPSFTRPIDSGHVGTELDFILLLPRTEYHCARCGGHQGHVFDDGPPPLGERWCNNGLALDFVPGDRPLPELRG